MQVGRFECRERLGAGGFGEVWKAWDPSVGRWVALKLLKNADDERRARFEREARLVASLEHPNIAGIYEVGEHEGRPYLAMQLVDGRSLRGWKGTPSDAARIIADAAGALHAAHERGVIHRDLKPDNLMLDSTGRVFVLDFGLARPVDASGLTASGMVVGTPSYMPPEQARGDAADPRSDVYALGATLYELLTQRAPFSASNVLDTLMAVIDGDLTPPRKLAPETPPELEAIVMKALDREPVRRYPSAQALAEDLARWRRGEPVEAKPVSIVSRFARRRRGVMMAAAVGVLLVGILVAVIQRRSGDTTETREQMVALMRTTAKSQLESILDRRRAGSLEGIEKASRAVEDVCERVRREFPALAEPDYLLGRLRRAQMDDDAALRHQEAALTRDPGFTEARYEHAVLIARRLCERIQELNTLRLRAAVQEVVGRIEARSWSLGELKPMLDKDEVVRSLRVQLDSDLDLLEGAGIADGERHCLRGFRAWSAFDAEAARIEFTAAVQRTPLLEEAYEAMTVLALSMGSHAEGIRWADEGLQRDRGYHPLLRGRVLLRHQWANQLRTHESGELFRLAEQDAALLVARTGGAVQARILHAAVLTSWAGRPGAPGHLRALEVLDAVLAQDPANLEARVRRGGVLANMAADRRHSLAEQLEFEARGERDLTAAIEAGADEARSFRGILRYNSGTRMLNRGEDALARLEEAMADFDAALKEHSGSANTWLNRAGARARIAVVLEQTRRAGGPLFDLALQDFSAALALSRNDPEDLVMRARARAVWANMLQDTGRDATTPFEHALKDLDLAISMAPRYAAGLRERGQTRVRFAIHQQMRGRPDAELLDGAEKDLTEAIALDGTNASGWMLRGNAKTRKAMMSANPDALFESADSDFSRAIELAGDDEDALLQRGSTRLTWSQRSASRASDLRKSAVRDLEEVLKLSPRRAEAWRMLGAVLSGMAREPGDERRLHDRAVECGERAAQIQPALYENWIALGASLVNRSSWKMSQAHLGEDPAPDFEAAQRALTKGMELNPGEAKGWEFLGNLHVNRGMYGDWKGTRRDEPWQEALDAYAKVEEINPGMKRLLEARKQRCRKRLEKN